MPCACLPREPSEGSDHGGRCPAAPFTRRALWRALWHVLNRHGAGLDGLDPQLVRHDPALQRHLVESAYWLLRTGHYRFWGSRRGYLPRPGKPPREHAISTVRDGMVLRAVAEALAPVWSKLPAAVTGGRPGRSALDLVRQVSKYIAAGEGWALKFDVVGAYGNAPFDRCLEALASLTDRHDLVSLIRRWRRVQGSRFGGLPEGSPIAPLLLACLLGTTVIPALEAVADVVGLHVDDGVALVRTEDAAKQARDIAVAKLAELGLQMHPEKSRIVHLDPKGESDLDFLGFSWKGMLAVPSQASQDALLDALHRKGLPDGPAVVDRLIMGWADYFITDSPDLETIRMLDERIQVRFAHLAAPSLLRIAFERVALKLNAGVQVRDMTGKSRRLSTCCSSTFTLLHFPWEVHQSDHLLSAAGAAGSAPAGLDVAPAGRGLSPRGTRRRRTADRLSAITAALISLARQVPALSQGAVADLVATTVHGLDDLRRALLEDRKGDLRYFRTLALPPLDDELLAAAIARSTEISESRKPSHNLGLICLEFLATNDFTRAGRMQTMRFIANLERTMGVKLIVLDKELDLVYGNLNLNALIDKVQAEQADEESPTGVGDGSAEVP